MITRAIVVTLTLTLAAGAALAQGTQPTGVVHYGSISLNRSEVKIPAGSFGPIDNTTDVLAGNFQAIDYSQYTPPQTQATTTTVGSCVVNVLTVPVVPAAAPAGVTPLDAGPVLNLNGPSGTVQIAQNISVPFPPNGPEYTGVLGGGQVLPIPGLAAPPPLFLAPGAYTVDNGGGGADVGPFQAALTIPSPLFSWTNADSDLSINRSAGVDLQWTGGDPTTQVNITGSVMVNDPATFQLTAGGNFACTANNSDGHFLLTPDVLTLLPSTFTSVGQPNSNISNITVANSTTATISAAGVDTGALVFQVGNTRVVTLQ